MKRFFCVVGVIYVALTVLAMFDAIDFHVCIGPAGKCPSYAQAAKVKI